MILKHFENAETVTTYVGKGCDVCHSTGFTGRTGLFEVLEVSPKIRELINQKADASIIQNQAIAEGMTTMLDDGLNKVKAGVTTLEEVMRAVRS